MTISDVISLGQKIVEGLRKDDLLTQWMAHHVAERMAGLKHVPAASLQQAEDDLSALILRLWEHGRSDAFDEDPTRLSASVVRAVAKLDPEPGEPYFRAFGFVPRPARTGTELDEYLRLALSLDSQVRRLILSLVTYAAALAEDRETEWIQQLQKVNADPLLLIRDLSSYPVDVNHDQPDRLDARKQSIASQAAAIRDLLKPVARRAPSTPTSTRLRQRSIDEDEEQTG